MPVFDLTLFCAIYKKRRILFWRRLKYRGGVAALLRLPALFYDRHSFFILESRPGSPLEYLKLSFSRFHLSGQILPPMLLVPINVPMTVSVNAYKIVLAIIVLIIIYMVDTQKLIGLGKSTYLANIIVFGPNLRFSFPSCKQLLLSARYIFATIIKFDIS